MFKRSLLLLSLVVIVVSLLVSNENYFIAAQTNTTNTTTTENTTTTTSSATTSTSSQQTTTTATSATTTTTQQQTTAATTTQAAAPITFPPPPTTSIVTTAAPATPSPPTGPPVNYNIVEVHFDLILFYVDYSLFGGTTSQQVWKFFDIFCSTFGKVPTNQYSCQPAGSTRDIILKLAHPTVLRPVVAARRFLSGSYVIPSNNNTYLMTLMFRGAHDAVQALMDMLQAGSHHEALGVLHTYPMPALNTIYDLGTAGGDKVRIGSYDTQLSVAWHLIISVGTILVVVSIYILRVRSHPEQIGVQQAARDQATGTGADNTDDLEEPNYTERWLPTSTADHRDRLLNHAYIADEKAHEIQEFNAVESMRKGERDVLSRLPFGDSRITHEMKRSVDLVDGVLEVIPQMKLPPEDMSSAQFKKMKAMKRRRFVMLAKLGRNNNNNTGDSEDDSDDGNNDGKKKKKKKKKNKNKKKGEGGNNEDDESSSSEEEIEEEVEEINPKTGEKKKVIVKKMQKKKKKLDPSLRNDLTALGAGVNATEAEKVALGLSRRRLAASMTTFAVAQSEGRLNLPYKETETNMITLSPLQQRREQRGQVPEMTWQEMRRMQDVYEKEVLAEAAKKAGMNEPSDELERRFLEKQQQQNRNSSLSVDRHDDGEQATKNLELEIQEQDDDDFADLDAPPEMPELDDDDDYIDPDEI